MNNCTRIRTLALALVGVVAVAAHAAPTVRVAVIDDGPVYQFAQVRELFVDELLALTRGEFDVEIVSFSGGWTREGIGKAFDDAYADPAIDMVLVFGFAANQINVSRETFPKPTFLPLVFDLELMGAPVSGKQSGKRNLNYLAERASLASELRTYQRVMPFESAAILIDGLILESLPQLDQASEAVSRETGHCAAIRQPRRQQPRSELTIARRNRRRDLHGPPAASAGGLRHLRGRC